MQVFLFDLSYPVYFFQSCQTFYLITSYLTSTPPIHSIITETEQVWVQVLLERLTLEEISSSLCCWIGSDWTIKTYRGSLIEIKIQRCCSCDRFTFLTKIVGTASDLDLWTINTVGQLSISCFKYCFSVKFCWRAMTWWNCHSPWPQPWPWHPWWPWWPWCHRSQSPSLASNAPLSMSLIVLTRLPGKKALTYQFTLWLFRFFQFVFLWMFRFSSNLFHVAKDSNILASIPGNPQAVSL